MAIVCPLLTSQGLELRLVAGFIVIFSSTVLLNKLGDILYHRGMAKPFYLRGYRLHHAESLRANRALGYAWDDDIARDAAQ